MLIKDLGIYSCVVFHVRDYTYILGTKLNKPWLKGSGMPNPPTKKIIHGVTDTGENFRPSDWAERMSGSLSTFENNRIQYSALLYPSMVEGIRCVVVDSALNDTNPELYKYILDFAKKNHLKVSEVSSQ